MIAGSVHDCSNSLQMPFIQMIAQSNIHFDWLMHVSFFQTLLAHGEGGGPTSGIPFG